MELIFKLESLKTEFDSEIGELLSWRIKFWMKMGNNEFDNFDKLQSEAIKWSKLVNKAKKNLSKSINFSEAKSFHLRNYSYFVKY